MSSDFKLPKNARKIAETSVGRSSDAVRAKLRELEQRQRECPHRRAQLWGRGCEPCRIREAEITALEWLLGKQECLVSEERRPTGGQGA